MDILDFRCNKCGETFSVSHGNAGRGGKLSDEELKKLKEEGTNMIEIGGALPDFVQRIKTHSSSKGGCDGKIEFESYSIAC